MQWGDIGGMKEVKRSLQEAVEMAQALALSEGIFTGTSGGGVLAPCAVFDTNSGAGYDYVTLPGGARHGGSDCPEGAALAPGDALSWTSNDRHQGTVGYDDNGCAAKGTCGLPWSDYGLGGGWQLCFA